MANFSAKRDNAASIANCGIGMGGLTETGREGRLWQRAERYLAENNPDAARASLEALVGRQPGHLMARLRLSTLATSQGRCRDSLAQLLAIADSQPADPYLLVMLAGLLHRLGESRAAMQCLEHPGFERSGDQGLLEEAAQLALQLERLPRALALLDAADRLGAATATSLYTRATAQLFRGSLEDASTTLASCIALAPAHAQAHRTLARLRRQTPDSNHTARLRSLLESQPPLASEVFLAFALFKELDDLGEHEAAWQALMRGCAGKRQLLDYRPQDEPAAFASLLAFPRSLPPRDAAVAPEDAARAALDAASPRPIFIVGMPRTGTTLLEQVLGRHPAVQNAGELDDFPLQLRWCANRFAKSHVDLALFDSARSVDFAQLGRRYLQHAGWRAGDKPVFTDKLPLNFLYVGFIAEALPQARILHMVRGPMDTCFSNLKELFADAYPYSYELGELADQYGRYRQLMAHWHRQYPGRILDVSYEALVSDTEAVVAAIQQFCALPAAPEYGEEAAQPRVVTTASSVQVREPIHRRGVDGWRRYEAQLAPLQARLRADGWL